MNVQDINKISDGEATLPHVWWTWTISFTNINHSSLCSRVLIPIKALSMSQMGQFNHL